MINPEIHPGMPHSGVRARSSILRLGPHHSQVLPEGRTSALHQARWPVCTHPGTGRYSEQGDDGISRESVPVYILCHAIPI